MTHNDRTLRGAPGRWFPNRAQNLPAQGGGGTGRTGSARPLGGTGAVPGRWSFPYASTRARLPARRQPGTRLRSRPGRCPGRGKPDRRTGLPGSSSRPGPRSMHGRESGRCRRCCSCPSRAARPWKGWAGSRSRRQVSVGDVGRQVRTCRSRDSPARARPSARDRPRAARGPRLTAIESFLVGQALA